MLSRVVSAFSALYSIAMLRAESCHSAYGTDSQPAVPDHELQTMNSLTGERETGVTVHHDLFPDHELHTMNSLTGERGTGVTVHPDLFV